ncbi:hypothetical protein LDENG_00251760 [Lucifuga dentata]|nr:hypothetical protein LDENG_00251760 [Lucifuga dentata]
MKFCFDFSSFATAQILSDLSHHCFQWRPVSMASSWSLGLHLVRVCLLIGFFIWVKYWAN